MKTRTGFVSNSSTSSFFCPICNEIYTGMDDNTYEDMGFSRCENNHLYCSSCSRKHKKCPLCSLEIIEQWSVISYLLKTCGKTNEEIKKEMRDKFASYNDMTDFLGEKRRQKLRVEDNEYF